MTKEHEKKENRNGLFELTVKVVIINDEKKVLVLHRSKDDPISPEKLDLPGGKIMVGEKIEEALNREIKEELGIEVEIGPVVHYIDWEEINYCKGFRFLAFYQNGEIKISEEHSSFEWMEIDEAISKFKDNGFEKDKRDTFIKTKEYLGLKNSLDGWKRCQADFENHKKRQAESQKDMMKYLTEGIVMQVLPVLDNFRISTEHVPEDQKNSPWVVGIMHIQKQLTDVLKDNGVEEIETKAGDEFDPNIHEAVGNDERAEENKEEKKNKVAKVILHGYKMGGKVVRPVRVQVG